jgi:filamentous hemagglutinin family protein
MKGCYLEKSLIPGSVLIALFSSNLVAAQVVGDTTLPAGERSQVLGNPNFQIDGGARRGGNLFHSFQQFSIPTGGSAFFNNAADVQNILARVTGGSISNINGLIRANGTANLFLLNPNGILFGAGAQLNIGGSFVASTANSINFADNFQYSATNPQAAPLLTVSVPVGLQMGANPGAIRMQGTGYDLSVQVPIYSPIIRGSSSSGLRVPPGKTLALVGGDVDIQGGTLTAEQGRIELGSVGEGQVSLSPIPQGFALSYQGVQSFRDIRLSQQALADASGGSIQVQGNNVALADGSLIFIQNQGVQQGGNISINATQSLDVSGTSPDARLWGGLHSQAVGSGSGADIVISTKELVVRDAASITTLSYSPGKAGNVTVNASDSVQVIGFSPINLTFSSNISAGAVSSGDAGDVTVSTGRLTVLNGGGVGSPTFGTGNGGDVTVNATESVEVMGYIPILFTGSSVSSVTLNHGDAGKVTINTSRLVVRDGGAVSTSTVATGDAGSITINAKESVEVSGTVLGSPNPSYVGASAPLLSQSYQQAFRLPPVPSGFSGDVTINTGQLKVTDGARVEVSNQGVGNAGILRINANSIFLDAGGALTAATASGQGGKIDLNVGDVLLLQNNSQITTSAGGTGNGGDISITARSLSALNGSQLSAATAGTGNAGNITLSADTVGLSSGGRLLTTTSSSGRAGNITVKTPDLQLSGATSGLFAGTTGTGDAGNLTIQPRENGQSVRVNLQDGAQITASTSSSGHGGQLTITAPESITLTGDGSIIAAGTGGSGAGGNLTLSTGDLNIQNQAEVTVSSKGTGTAGSLFVDANQIYLDNQGRIRADTTGGGGNITLRSPLILLRHGSNISTNATGSNILGGNIGIDTRFLVAIPSENSDISANSEDFRGGNVSINAYSLFGIEPRLRPTPSSDITATGATLALAGTINVNTVIIDPTSGLVPLPTDVVDASRLIATGCAATQGNSFVVTGRGGLPPNPEQQLDDDAEWLDRRQLVVAQHTQQPTDNSPTPHTLKPTAHTRLIEATGWQITPTGKVILVATTPDPTVQHPLHPPVACRLRE